MSSDSDVLRAFLQLFQWVFEIELPPTHSRAIEHEVRVGWANNDPSERELVAYVLDTYTLITRAPSSERGKRRLEAKRIIAKMFAKTEANDRGRVLATIHQAIESLRPGATGVPLPTSQGGGRSGPGASVSAPSHAHLPQLAYSSGGPPFTSSPTAYPAPSMGYTAQPMGYPPQQIGYPPYVPPNWAAAFAPPPPPDPQIAAMRSVQQQQRDLQAEIQKITMESNISAMRHSAMMTVIGNIK